MATYIGSKKVSSGGSNLTASEKRIYAKTPEGQKQSTTQVTKQDGKTYVTNSRGKVIELATSNLRATPEAATVLKDIKHSDVNKVKVDYGKYKTRTEVTEEQYNSYRNDPKNFYKNNRMPEPTQQTIRTERQATVGTKGIAQWSAGTQQNIKNAQSEIKRTRPYADTIGQARMNLPPKQIPQGQPVPWKTRDSVTGVLTPTIAYETKVPFKPQYSQMSSVEQNRLKSTQEKRFEKVAENYELKIKPKVNKINKFWVENPANTITQTKSPFTTVISAITKTKPKPEVPYEKRGIIGKTATEVVSLPLMLNPIPMGTFIADVGIKGYTAGLGSGTKKYKQDIIREFTIDAPNRALQVYKKPSTYIIAGLGAGISTNLKLKLPNKLPENINLKTDSYYKTADVTSNPTLKGSKGQTGGVKATDIVKRDTHLVSELNKVVNNKPVVSVTRGVKGDTTFTQVTVKGQTYSVISRGGNVVRVPKVSVTRMVGENLITKTTRFTKGKLKPTTSFSKPIVTKTTEEIQISTGENINVLKGSKGELQAKSLNKISNVQERNMGLFRKQVIRTIETTKSSSSTRLASSNTGYTKGQYLRLSDKSGAERRFQNIFYSKSRKAKLQFGELEPPKDFKPLDIRTSKSPSGNIDIENIMFTEYKGSRLLSETKFNRDTFAKTTINTEFKNPFLKIKGKKAQVTSFEPKTELFSEEVLKIGQEPKFKQTRTKLKSDVKLFEGVKTGNKIIGSPILSIKTDPNIKTNINTQTNILKTSQTPQFKVINRQITQPKSIFDVRTRVTQKVDLKQDYITKLSTTKITSYNPFVNNYTFKPNIPNPIPPPPFIGGGFFKGIGSGTGYSNTISRTLGKQRKKYTAGAWEAAFGIKGKKSGTFTGIGIRPIATN